VQGSNTVIDIKNWTKKGIIYNCFYYLKQRTFGLFRWPERNWRILFVPLNFVNVGMPQWFFDLKCNFRLWVPHFKAFSIKSCHSRILRLLHTLSFFKIHKSLTQEKKLHNVSTILAVWPQSKGVISIQSTYLATLITTSSYSVPFHLSHTPNTTCVAPLQHLQCLAPKENPAKIWNGKSTPSSLC